MFLHPKTWQYVRVNLSLFALGLAGCPTLSPQNAGDQFPNVVTIENAFNGVIGYIDFDGKNIAYIFGEKNDKGEMTKLNAMVLLNTEKGTFIQYLFDTQSRLSSMISGDKTFDVSYSADNQFITLTNGNMSTTEPLPPEFTTLLNAAKTGTLNINKSTTSRVSASDVFGVVGGVLLIGLALAGIVVSVSAAPSVAAAIGAGAGTEAGLQLTAVFGGLAGVFSGSVAMGSAIGALPRDDTFITILNVADTVAVCNTSAVCNVGGFGA